MKQDLVRKFKYFRSIFTPIKMLSVLLILLGAVDHLADPIEHVHLEECTTEWLIRSLFVFAGMFGIMGNGRTSDLRAVVVGLPYLYLATLYIIRYIQTGTIALLLPLIIISVLGLWTVFIGGEYERTTYSGINRPTGWDSPKSDT